ncbi:MAG: ELM1/GtrOC1 family putative glycosyltransferase, partial [Geminicoccaceae bacterium]
PYVVVNIGGQAGPYDFDARAATLLGRWASRMANARRGSVLMTTSRRTPAESLPALRAAITAPSYIYEWTKETREGRENPYFGMLALADALIVTCDSMSMLAEACFTKKPVYIFDLDDTPGSHRPPWPEGVPPPPADASWRDRWRAFRLQPLVYRLGMLAGPKRLTRDVRIIHHRLVESGRAVWLGQEFTDRGDTPPPPDDIERAVLRVRALFGSDDTQNADRSDAGAAS